MVLSCYVLCEGDYYELIERLDDDSISLNEENRQAKDTSKVNKGNDNHFARLSDVSFASKIKPLDEFAVNEKNKFVGQSKCKLSINLYPLNTGCNFNVHKAFRRTSFEHCVYIFLTSCVQG